MAVFPGEDGLHDRKHVRAVLKGAAALEEAHKAPLLKDGRAVLQDGFPQCLVKLHFQIFINLSSVSVCMRWTFILVIVTRWLSP